MRGWGRWVWCLVYLVLEVLEVLTGFHHDLDRSPVHSLFEPCGGAALALCLLYEPPTPSFAWKGLGTCPTHSYYCCCCCFCCW